MLGLFEKPDRVDDRHVLGERFGCRSHDLVGLRDRQRIDAVFLEDMPAAARNLLGQDRALEDQYRNRIGRPAVAAVAGSASTWPVSSTANSAAVRGARIAAAITPVMPIIAHGPGPPGNTSPINPPNAPPMISSGARMPPVVPAPRATRQEPKHAV